MNKDKPLTYLSQYISNQLIWSVFFEISESNLYPAAGSANTWCDLPFGGRQYPDYP